MKISLYKLNKHPNIQIKYAQINSLKLDKISDQDFNKNIDIKIMTMHSLKFNLVLT